MSDLRAITLWQPYASLVAERVKWIETRLRPYPWNSAIGETVGIHASTKRPADPTVLGGYRVRGYGTNGRALVGPGLPEFRSVPRLEGYILPLGAMVATARLLDVVPMVDFITEREDVRTRVEKINDTLWLRVPGERPARDITDQLPFGGFAPGRHALLLDQIVKLRTPVREIGGHHQGLWSVPPADVARIEEAAA